MSSIADMSHQTGATVAGVYRVVGIRPGHARHDGRPSIRLWIADASATRLCGGYQAEIDLSAEQVERGALVAIRGHVERTPKRRLYIRLASCRPVAVADRPSWQLLPRTWVPAGAEVAFERLLQLLDRLAPWPLRNFMERVLADPGRAKRFLTAPARTGNHQSAPGSLLVESVTRAEKAERIAPRLLLSRDEVALAVVGALLRRFGQAERPSAAVTRNPRRARAHTIQALEAPLSAARPREADWLLELCGILAPETVASTRRASRSLTADLVHALDGLTTAGDLARSQHAIRTSDGQLLARVLLPGRGPAQ